MAEWRRLRRLRTQLEPLAYIFERTNSACTGECDRPKVIYQDKDTGEKITCCNLQAPWERYHETRKLEKQMNSKVHLGRKPFETAKHRKIDSPLKEAYPRSHTGTWVGRKLVVENQEAPEAEPHASPKAKPKVSMR